MTYQHANMALYADGITPTEKLVLIAYAEHADHHGYCWPSAQRLADITGLSRATVTRANTSLRNKGLIKSVRRVNPKTHEPISNLTRINVALLDSMRRRDVERYADLIHEITFPEDDHEDATETGSDQLIHHGEPYLGLTVSHTPSHHEPQTNQRNNQRTSSSPDPSTARQSQPSHRQEEEAEAFEDQHADTAAALVAELPTIATRAGRPLRRPLLPSETTRLTQPITAALARGWTPDQIRAVLATDLDSARSVVATWAHRLRDLGDPPPATPAHDATAAQREAQARARAERAEMEARRARDVAAHAARARAILAAACKSA